MEAKTTVNKTTFNNKDKESLEDVMIDLEKKINPKSMKEGLQQLETAIKQNNPSNLFEAGAKEFEARVGRPMTYGEMRAMWG